MNPELTPGERAEMRDTVLAGAQRLRSAGQRRMQLVAAAVALVLVGGISGGAVATAAYLGSTTSATPTATSVATASPDPEPIPTSSPTATPSVAPPSAAGEDCGSVLSTTEVAAIIGQPVGEPLPPITYDPGLLGGVTCSWRSAEVNWKQLTVAVLPASVVPASVSSLAGVVPDCIGGAPCEYAELSGDAWVHATGSHAEEVVAAVQAALPRAAAILGTPVRPDGTWWNVPACEDLRRFISSYLARSDLSPYRGDAMPSGMDWDVAELNGIASWCSSLGDSADPGRVMEEIEVYVSPGSTSPAGHAPDHAPSTPIEVVGASSAWYSVIDNQNEAERIIATTGANTIVVYSRFLDTDTLAALTGALIEHLDSAAG